MSGHSPIHLRLGHSPDPDDAFMWYPLSALAPGGIRVETAPFALHLIVDDVSSLNRRAESAELEITALSTAQYPFVADRYILTDCGASLGDGYGPRLVARTPIDPRSLAASGASIAVPGIRTTAFATLSLLLGPGSFRHAVAPFDEIPSLVADGTFDAGLVIHESQLTHSDLGLVCLADLGEWWTRTRSLPLPLGANALLRDLDARFGQGTIPRITRILRDSIRSALAHRAESLEYARRFGRGIDSARADRFVSMYANDSSVDYGPRGRNAVLRFLSESADAGLVPPLDPSLSHFVAPSD